MFDGGMAIGSKANVTTLYELAAWIEQPVVTVFIPLDFGQPKPQVVIERALRQAAQAALARLVTEHGMDRIRAEAFATRLIDDHLLDDIPTAARGLAVFLSQARKECLALPVDVGAGVRIGERPDLLRLLPAFIEDTEYFCLLLDKKGAHLFRCSHFTFEPVSVPTMPGSIDEALWYIRREPILSRNGNGMVYSSGGGQDLRKDDVRHFLHLVDQAVASALNGLDLPLVVVGVEYETAMFLNSTKYRHVVTTPVLGSPDTIARKELHRRSWELASRHVHDAQHVVAQLGALAGTGKTSSDPESVAVAAAEGAVAQLVVRRSVTDASFGESARDHRLVVAALNETLRHQGTVHVVDDADIPAGAPLAAIFRF
jgi:hypothetical protein